MLRRFRCVQIFLKTTSARFHLLCHSLCTKSNKHMLTPAYAFVNAEKAHLCRSPCEHYGSVLLCNVIIHLPSRDRLYKANILCTGTAVLEFNYEGEARESFRTPSFWKQKRRAARFATSSSLFLTYLVVISSDFNTDFCVAHTAVRRW